MISKDYILDMISDEKNKYSIYMQACTYYKIDPDPFATVKCSAKIEILEHILKSM